MRLQASNDMDLGDDEVALHDASNPTSQSISWPVAELEVHPLSDHDDDASMTFSPELVQQRLSQPASPPSQRVAFDHGVHISRQNRRCIFGSDATSTQHGTHSMHSPPSMTPASAYLDGRAVAMPVASTAHHNAPPPAIYSGTMSSSPPFGHAAIRHAQHAPQPIGPPTPVGFNPSPSANIPFNRQATGSPEPNVVGYERQTVQQRRARRVVHDPTGPTTYENEGLVPNKFYSQDEDHQAVVKELLELRRGFDDLHDSEQRIEQKQQQQEGWKLRKPSRTFLDDSDKSTSSMLSAKVEFKHKSGFVGNDNKWRDGCYVQLRQPPSSPVFDRFSKAVPSISVEKVKFAPRQ
eukprot:m.124242 g.124242  ORF g.124242 m.124242 type:complete len:350 (+) comp15699_c0_seq1:2284-3333(+)